MRSLLIATLMLSSFSAFAAESGSGSEFFWQAGAGQTFIMPELEYGDGSVDFKGGGSADATATNLSVAGEYGYSADMSFGAKLTMVNEETESGGSSTKDSGLGDIDLYMKGTHGLTSGVLKYGATLSLSPGNYEEEANGDGNGYSGGHSIAPYIGYETKADSVTFGGLASYTLGLGDSTSEDSTGTETKTSGGDVLALTAFAETAHAAGSVGGSLTYAMASDTESGGTESESSDLIKLAVYGDYGLNEGTTLTGSLSYDMIGSTDVVDEGSGFTLLLGARFAL